MPTLVIKSFPEELHLRLKETAAAHRRSVTQETIHLLEKALMAGAGGDTRSERPSYWATRTLLPEFEAALRDEAFSSGTESTKAIRDERDDR